MRRVVGRVTLGLLALAAVLVASFAALTSLPQLESQRRSVAEHLLGRLNDRPVEISGPVNVSIAPLMTVTMSDIAIGERGATATERALHMREVVLSFSLAKLAQGKFELEALSITGITFEMSVAGTKGDR